MVTLITFSEPSPPAALSDAPPDSSGLHQSASSEPPLGLCAGNDVMGSHHVRHLHQRRRGKRAGEEGGRPRAVDRSHGV